MVWKRQPATPGNAVAFGSGAEGGGGGQPRFTDDAVRLKRIQAIYAEDEGKTLRKSHENPAVQQLYREFLGEPLGAKSHELLHTHYKPSL